jgi:Holliday junction resolvase RusA-like endonuclease
VVHFVLPYFPPSTNKAYYVRQGRMHMSEVGKSFKRGVLSYITQHYMKEIKNFKTNVPYMLHLRFHFEDGIENKGWGKGGAKKCETRYKKWDATNRVKLAEDAIRDALGIDDSQFIGVLTEKAEPYRTSENGELTSHFEVRIWNLEVERSPLDGFLQG